MLIHHTRMVVRECCKGDDESLRARAKFDRPPPRYSLTDRHQHLHRWLCRGCLPSCKNLIQIA